MLEVLHHGGGLNIVAVVRTSAGSSGRCAA
jgi:hypothetical protein